jgi:hypothetical protein
LVPEAIFSRGKEPAFLKSPLGIHPNTWIWKTTMICIQGYTLQDYNWEKLETISACNKRGWWSNYGSFILGSAMHQFQTIPARGWIMPPPQMSMS